MTAPKNKMIVAVTGAAGQIGYALLFRIAAGEMFGPNTEIELRLLELEAALPALQGVAMELEDGAFPLLKNIVCTSDLKTAMDGANWALLVGSVPRKAGMERSDLLKINGGIFTSQGQAINRYAASDVRVFVVGNPCNTNCLIAKHSAPDVPGDRFFAMTALDELRAKALLARTAHVDTTEVSRIAIWGNHSATQYPDFYNAKIRGVPATQIITDEKWLQNDFVQQVQQRGAAIIQARGASSAASAANAAIFGVRALVFETAKDDFYSMAVHSHGEYGVDEGLIFSFPCVTKNQKWHIVPDIGHNEFGKQKFIATLQELRSERDAVREMGLI